MANHATIRARLQDEVAARGANAVAKGLGVPRGTLISFLAGTARLGSAQLIESRALALVGFDVVPPSRIT